MLWIALELPSLPLQVVERAGAARDALVVCEGPQQRPLVTCANAAARELGVREGQAVAAAKAIAGELRVVARDLASERKALEGIAAWAGQYTPMVCLDGQGIVMEIASTLRLFEGHARLTAAVQRGIRELGFHAVLGVAPTPLAARLFARAEAQGRAVRGCLALAELRERVAELPLFLLELPEKTLTHLTDLGVLRLRDLLELPAEGLARRFGPEIALALDRLVGRVPDPRVPYAPPARLRSRLELPAEADGIEALLFPLKRLLAEFEGALRGRGAGVQQLTLLLEHGRRARTRVPLEFASPEREADFILAIARERLGGLTLPAATLALDLRAEALLPYVPRAGAWLPGAKEQAVDLQRLVERLAARMGKERVFGIALADDHRPEKDWAPANAGVTPRHPRAQNARHPPAQNARHPPAQNARHPRVGGDPVASLRPTWLLQRPQRLVSVAGKPTLQGELQLGAGPERIEAGWWDGEEVRRDYYIATSARGEAYWVFREHRDLDAWYLHGVFA